MVQNVLFSDSQSPRWSDAERSAPKTAEEVAEVLAVAGALGRANPGRMRVAQTTIGPAKAHVRQLNAWSSESSSSSSSIWRVFRGRRTRTSMPRIRRAIRLTPMRQGGRSKPQPFREHANAVSKLGRVEWDSCAIALPASRRQTPPRSIKILPNTAHLHPSRVTS
jgi:hypothetical protein